MRFSDIFGSTNKLHHTWKELKSFDQIDDIVLESMERTVLIFKHSTRCGISNKVKDDLLFNYDISPQKLSFYYLDLIEFRSLSNEIANRFNVAHQSPQIVLLRNGMAVYDASHHSISLKLIKEKIA